MSLNDTPIGEWTATKLTRFIQTVVHTLPNPTSLQASDVRATRKLTVEQELVLSAEAIRYLKSQLGL